MSPPTPTESLPYHEYPNGHLNHLSTEHIKALEEFKKTCQLDGCYSPSNQYCKASHDDETMLRFLRARKFVPKDAFQQFQATEKWRKEQDIDNWYDTIDVDQYEATRLVYTHWTGHRDKRGIPLYVFHIGGLDMKKMSEYESSLSTTAPTTSESHPQQLSPKLRRLFATYEHLTHFVMPLCSAVPSRPYHETPISQTCNIIDISGMGLRQFWGLKAHLQSASALATAHYPETLGRTFIIGAPSFFPTVWGWLKGWFDANTVSKIMILSQAQVEATLREHIDLESIPKRYGGTLDWEFGQHPDLDPEISKILGLVDGAVTIPPGPIRWRDNEDSAVMEAHAVGTLAGKPRDEVIGRVESDLFASGSAPDHRT